ncbi:MAG: phosphoglucomutase/phosphomannomutase family protein [bacterium]|nr:phosphoglucomutase/phosphomannomutase family protein [bacterium]MDD5755691.1 phosphoglucomutase/phosphomannomutase family protein [bacterium]
MSTEIKFGTDGWRGIIARDFTFNNVRLVTQSISDYLKKQSAVSGQRSAVIVGYDCRFLSREYANAVAAVLSGNGFKVLLSLESVPTPAVSYNVVNIKAAGAIIITASHNPYEFNGLKFKTRQGASAHPEVTRLFEQSLAQAQICQAQGNIKKIDLTKSYLKQLVSMVDIKKIRRRKMRIVIDPLFGAGQGCLEELLTGGSLKIHSINSVNDPLFGGIHPEPIASNLGPLITAVKCVKADIGIALDGDADRIGLIDSQGIFVNSHQIFSLLLLHLIKNKGKKGAVVKTISGTYLIERICREYNLKLYETPIGFKYIGDIMLKEKVLIGGEESGGIGFSGHIPERDGILSALYMLELMAITGQNLVSLKKELFTEFGLSCYDRIDLKLGHTQHHHIDKKEFSRQIAGFTSSLPMVKEVKDYDGVKVIFEDDRWLLLRPSGTEPVVRIYAEANNQSKVKKLIDLGQKLVYKVQK